MEFIVKKKGMDDKAITRKIHEELQWSFMRDDKLKYILFVVLCVISFTLQYTVIPDTIANLIRVLTTKKTFPFIPEKEIIWKVWNNLIQKNAAGLIVFLLLSWMTVAILYMGQETLSMKLLPKHLHHIRQRMFEGLIERHREEYDDIPSGEAIARILDVSRLYAYQSEYVVVTLIPYIIGLIVVLIFTYRSNAILGGVATVGLGAMITNAVLWGRKISKISFDREDMYIRMVESMNNNFNNLMNVYINNKEDDTVKENNKLNLEHTSMFQEELIAARNSNAASTVLSVIVFCIILIVGYQKVKQGAMSGIKLGALITVYFMYMHWSLELFHNLPYIFRKFGIWKNNYEFVSNLFKITDASRSSFVITQGFVELRDVTFQYPSAKVPVLENVNMKIEKGERVAIVGRSGSGKTTIMKLIVGLYNPTRGKILLDGHDAQDIKINEIRQKVNYINQRTTLMNDSILRNIQYGNSATREEVVALLRKYEISDIFSESKIEHGIDAVAGVNGGLLSLGMQKTVIVTRGILRRDSLVYIFDEPVAGLDPDTRKKIMDMITEECAGKTIICVTHSQEIEGFVERVINILPNQTTLLHSRQYGYQRINTM